MMHHEKKPSNGVVKVFITVTEISQKEDVFTRTGTREKESMNVKYARNWSILDIVPPYIF